MDTTDLVKMLDNSSNDSWEERIFSRCNMYYLHNKPLWEKAIKAYNGGKAYISSVLVKHPSETDTEYTDRVNSSYNLNLIKYAVKEFGNYIFSKTPRRQGASKIITEDFDCQKKQVNEVMWQLFNYHNLCGIVWALVDMPELDGNYVDLATKDKQKIRPWCRVLSPLSVPDWCFDRFGELDWIIVEEFIIDKQDPTREPVMIKKRTLYTKTYYQVFSAVVADGNNDNAFTNTITVSPRKPNRLGIVPIIPYSDILFDRDFNTPEIADILTIYDAILKGESELLTNILKQTYGQLVLPTSSHSMVSKVKSRLAKDGYDITSTIADKIIAQEVGIELSRTKAIFEDDVERGIARYIQPTGATTDSIINHNDRLIQLTMKMTGFLVGIGSTQRASADSKAIDNASMAAQLIRISTKLQELENNLWILFNKFDSTIKVPKIYYNKDYDIHEFNAVISGLVELCNINAGDNFKKQFKRTAVHAMDSIHRIPDDVYEAIEHDIETDKESTTPAKFEDKAKHSTDASGSTPDNIKARSDYAKGTTNNIGKTESIK